DDAAPVGTARAVALDLDVLAVAVVAFALELPARAVALGLALIMRALAVAVRRRRIALDRLHASVVHLVGLLRALAGAAPRRHVAVHGDLVAVLRHVAGARGRLPAAGLDVRRAARAVAGVGLARRAARPRARPASAVAAGVAVHAADRAASASPAPRALGVERAGREDEGCGEDDRRGRAQAGPDVVRAHQRPPFPSPPVRGLSPSVGPLIARKSTFCAPSGASNVNRPSGSVGLRTQRRSVAAYCGSPASST